MSIGQMLRARADADPARPAIVATADGVTLSRGQLAALAARLLEVAGGPGATFALVTESRLAQAALVAAGLMAGCVVCPINPAASAEIRGRLIRHAGARLVITDAALVDGLPIASAAALPPGGQGGLLVHTSGSTGDPKGVLLREAHVGANVAFAIAHFGYDDAWVTGSVLPLFHTFTVVSDLLPALVAGGRVIVTPGFAVAQLPATARALVEHQVRSYSGVPIVFDMMIAMRVPLPATMRFAIAGAAPLAEATRTRYQATYGHPILPCYGLTETTCFATASAPDAIRPGAVGRAAGIEVAIVDDAGAPVAAGVTGEIAHRGASVIRDGYFDDGGRNADAFTADGRFRSGDMGHLDDDGFLFITGRKKNMLIRGGEKVYLEDVDRCLASHPAIADSCTVRIGGHRHEDRAVAFVVPRADAAIDKDSIVAHVTAALGLVARLDDVVVTAAIPRSATGKVLREALVTQYGGSR